MKALVLSGGAGTRLRPITRTSAEQLVPVADKPLPFHGVEFLADAGITDAGTVVGGTAAEIEDAVGDGSKSCPRATCIPQGNPPGPVHAVLIAPAVRCPADSRADVCRTVVQGCRKGTGDVVDPLEVDRCVRTLLASDAPRGTAPDALTRAGTLDDLELDGFRPESAHGEGRDADLLAPARHRTPGRPDGACGADRDRVEHAEDRRGHGPCRSIDRTEARDELGHRPRLVVNRAAYTAVDDAETDEGRATPSPEGHPTDPRTTHGRSEPAGERAVPEEPPGASAVVCTPWLHGLHGTNFVRTMIGLESPRPAVDVLDDRRGQPTWSADVAERTAGLGARLGDGVYTTGGGGSGRSRCGTGSPPSRKHSPLSAKSCPSERNVSRCRSGQW